jgi:hypothetical protein
VGNLFSAAIPDAPNTQEEHLPPRVYRVLHGAGTECCRVQKDAPSCAGNTLAGTSDRRDGDGSDKGLEAVEVGVAFGEDYRNTLS